MLSDEDRQAIYDQVAASRESTAATNRAATAVEVRNALLVAISEDAARLLEQLPTFIENYQALANSQASTDEKLEDLHARQGVIDEKIKLILELERGQLNNIRDSKKRKEITERLDKAQALSLEAATTKRKLSKQVTNLQYLEEQAAQFGGRVPLDLVNQIEDVRQIIQGLQVEYMRSEE